MYTYDSIFDMLNGWSPNNDVLSYTSVVFPSIFQAFWFDVGTGGLLSLLSLSLERPGAACRSRETGKEIKGGWQEKKLKGVSRRRFISWFMVPDSYRGRRPYEYGVLDGGCVISVQGTTYSIFPGYPFWKITDFYVFCCDQIFGLPLFLVFGRFSL